MKKILVEVYIPAADVSFDVYISLQSKLYEVLYLFKNSFTELLNGYFIASDDTVICDRKTGTIFNINMSVEELELINGSKLMLI